MELNYEIIEKYLNGSLEANELDEFNKSLENNKEFKQEVDLYIEVNNTLTNKYSNLDKEKALKASLKDIGSKHFTNTSQNEQSKTKTVNLKRYFLSISSIAAILLVAFFLLKPQASLYDQFSNHTSIEIQVKGDLSDDLMEASNRFNKQKYSEAIPLFESYLRENPEDYDAQVYLGIALLESNKADDAQLIFEHIISLDNVFKNKALWYLSLTHLKNENIESTKSYLEQIAKDSFYSKDAKRLLKKL